MSKTWTHRRPRREQWRWCDTCRKQLHTERRYAAQAAAVNSREHEHAHRIYRCPAGPGYHLTTIRETR